MVSLCGLPSFFLSFSLVFLSSFSNFSTATISTRWVNNVAATNLTLYVDGSIVQTIILRSKGVSSPGYIAGFYCNGNCNTYLFAVCIVVVQSNGIPADFASSQVVWSTNRNSPIKNGATLELTSEGDLVLKDVDGMVAWSTNTSGKSVVGLNLTNLGNLVLFDKDNVIVWQSHDEPTDSLVLGQKLKQGQRLMASVSETNWTVDGMITLSMNGTVFSAQVETNPPQIYYMRIIPDPFEEFFENLYVELVNGSLSSFSNSTSNQIFISVPQASSAQYMKLCSDGHLRLYDLLGSRWIEVTDLFEKELSSDCDYPTVCGRYGICSGHCSCPASSGGTSYFQQIDDTKPNLGCFENVLLSCGASKIQSLLELKNVTYFGLDYLRFHADLMYITASSCIEACAKNCSCKAAIFWYELHPTSGNCYLQTQVFSLINLAYNSIAYLKVQNVTNEVPFTPVNHMSNRLPVILGSSLGALFAMMILIVAIVFFVQKRDDNQAEEAYLDHVNAH